MTAQTSPDPHLPEYRSPPIVEVAASVQFDNIRGLDAARLGLLWSRFRRAFPRTEFHPPLPTATESFDFARAPRVGFSVETSFPAPRLWFLNSDGTRLVQVQSNRLVVNWRQLDSQTPYLRFSGLRSMLEEAMSTLTEFLSDEDLGRLSPDQAELTYVNHIVAGDRGATRNSLAKYVSCWKDEPSQFEPRVAEETSFRTQYVVNRNGVSPARLFVELESGYASQSRVPIYVMNLIARGAPSAPTVAGAFDFFDDAHRWIVNGFTDLTTEYAHKLWERSK